MVFFTTPHKTTWQFDGFSTSNSLFNLFYSSNKPCTSVFRGVFRSVLARTPTPSTAGSSASNPAPSLELLDEAGTRRTSSSSSSRGAPRPIGRTETVGAKVGANTACDTGGVVGVGDGTTSEESRAGPSHEGNDDGTSAAAPPATTPTAATVSPVEQGDPSAAAEDLEQSLPGKAVVGRGTAETKVSGEDRVLGAENANERKTESREKEETRRESCRQHEHAIGVASVPRAEVLRMVRKQGHLRQKAMASDALRPILIDQHFTKVRLWTSLARNVLVVSIVPRLTRYHGLPAISVVLPLAIRIQ